MTTTACRLDGDSRSVLASPRATSLSTGASHSDSESVDLPLPPTLPLILPLSVPLSLDSCSKAGLPSAHRPHE
eukprot:4833356-Prymnesium_polylepis.2